MSTDIIYKDLDYFADTRIRLDMKRESMDRRHLRRMLGITLFSVGDILNISFSSGFITYGFEGICISVRKKRLKDGNASVKLRNILQGVGIELTISYFYKRIFKFALCNHKRKSFFYKRSKLYNIRHELNKYSRVK
jgi:ribosomal protein L19